MNYERAFYFFFPSVSLSLSFFLSIYTGGGRCNVNLHGAVRRLEMSHVKNVIRGKDAMLNLSFLCTYITIANRYRVVIKIRFSCNMKLSQLTSSKSFTSFFALYN
jgi:hypothetical protein